MHTLSDNEIRDIERGFFPIKLIWIGLLIALCVYIVVANILGEGMISDPDDPDDMFLLVGYVLYAIGAMELVIVYFIRKSITNPQSFISRIARYVSMTDVFTLTLSGGNPQSAIGRYISVMLVCLGLIQAVGIYGLILFILNSRFLDLYILTGIAILAQIYFRPKKQELIDLTSQLKQNNHRTNNRTLDISTSKCPQCAGTIAPIDRYCPFCGRPLD